MKHSLERLIDLVHKVIACRGEVFSEDHPLYKWKESFKTGKGDVKKYMRVRSLKLADKAKIGAFVEQCETQVINLSDFVYYEDSSILVKTDDNNSLHIMKGLRRLLAFMKDHFSNYLNDGSKLPLYEIDLIQSQFQLDYKRMRKKLTGVEDEYLLDLLFLPLSELTVSKEKLTLNLKYVRCFVEKLREFIAHRKELADDDYYLVDFLLATNFNTWNLFQYVIRSIKSEVQKQNSITDKMLVYTLFQKKIRQSFQFSDEILNPEAVTTKEQVLSWINEEVNSLTGGLKSEIYNHSEVKTNEKVKVLISVGKLAILFRAATDLKLISGSDAEIARYVSENFQTISGNSPSEKSFRNKFYDPETGTLENTLELLIDITRIVKSYLNPS